MIRIQSNIAPGQFCGRCPGEARHEHTVVAKAVHGTVNLLGEIRGLASSGWPKDSVFRGYRMIAQANRLETLFDLFIHRDQTEVSGSGIA